MGACSSTKDRMIIPKFANLQEDEKQVAERITQDFDETIKIISDMNSQLEQIYEKLMAPQQ